MIWLCVGIISISVLVGILRALFKTNNKNDWEGNESERVTQEKDRARANNWFGGGM
ncbi:hypothetical protein [Rossellomorea vietnamensis]|uniref:hypothetical protein n=1 Tax=Rossellomorea vietnamensis TaxID=218284 RepID=UPI003CEBC580